MACSSATQTPGAPTPPHRTAGRLLSCSGKNPGPQHQHAKQRQTLSHPPLPFAGRVQGKSCSRIGSDDMGTIRFPAARSVFSLKVIRRGARRRQEQFGSVASRLKVEKPPNGQVLSLSEFLDQRAAGQLLFRARIVSGVATRFATRSGRGRASTKSRSSQPGPWKRNAVGRAKYP